MVKAPEWQKMQPKTLDLNKFKWGTHSKFKSHDFPGLWLLLIHYSGHLYIMKDKKSCSDMNTICQPLFIDPWNPSFPIPQTITLKQINSESSYRFTLCSYCTRKSAPQLIDSANGQLIVQVNRFHFKPHDFRHPEYK